LRRTADSDIVSVDATMRPETTEEQFREMLRNLIIDRFELKTHVETKPISGYALLVAKNGPRLTESAASQGQDDSPPEPPPHKIGADGWPIPPAHMRGIGFQGMSGERARMLGRTVTMEELAKALSDLLDSKVVDATGLKAKYDIAVMYAGHLGGPRGMTALPQPALP
jgi:uncharacterized protein (TIGR03435 family)